MTEPCRVLITGAAGQLGKAILATLDADLGSAGWEVHPTNRDTLDVSDGGAVQDHVLKVEPNIVVNLAAYTDVDGAEADFDQAHAVNGLGPANLRRAADGVGARLIHVSTDYVFDGLAAAPYSERAAPNPLGAYGTSKLAGEQAVLAKTPDRRHLNHLVVRTSWLYGHEGRNFYTTMARLMAEHPVVKVVADQTGTPNPTWWVAEVLATLMRQCMAEPPEPHPVHGGRVIHASCQGTTTWHGFAKAIRQHLGATCDVEATTTEAFGRPAPRPAYSALACETLDALKVPRPTWQEGLARVPLPDLAAS